jgi:hypothetical protein
VRVALHAVERWRERVAPDDSIATANVEMRRIAANGTQSARPPRWTHSIPAKKYVQFITWHERPGIVLVISMRTGMVISVMSRSSEDTKRRALVRKPPKGRYA